jgi:hypothetical protein
MRQLPTGPSSIGIEIGVPSTLVAVSVLGVATAHFGLNVSRWKASLFSRKVRSSSAPPSM